MQSLFTKYKQVFWLLPILLFISLYYAYPQIFNFSPRSTHQWRQADSASIALNYYQNGMKFWQPQMHHELSGNGYTAPGGESTFPYYMVAAFYKVFGVNEGLFRSLNLLFFIAGLLALSALIRAITKDLFWAIAIPILLFSAPVNAFYAFNFIPNTSALGMVLVAWYCFYRYFQHQSLRWFYISMLFFTIAGLVKVSALLSFIALGGLFLLEQTGLVKWKGEEKLFDRPLQLLPAMALVLLAAFAWKSWADHFNLLHETRYFAAKVKPLWTLDATLRLKIFNRILYSWSWSYFHVATHILTILLSLFVFLKARRQQAFLLTLSLLLMIGVSLYGLLWYRKFNDHDYYAIDLMVYPLAIWLTALLYFSQYHGDTLKKPLLKLLMAGFLLFNLHHAKSILTYRYNPQSPYMSYFNPSFYKTKELQSFLRQHDIKYPDKVISVPDLSPNNTLYHLNLRGWTELYMGGTIPADRVRGFVDQGAKYFIVSDTSYLSKPWLQPFYEKAIGNFENAIFVFDIQGMGTAEESKKD